MHQVTTIHNAICFIESGLRKPVTVGQIADAVGYSLFHFSRTFNKIVQHTPYDYLMRRRLSESAIDLLLSDQRIIDIAYNYQFANPETYTRAFRRMFGLTPSRARSRGHLPYRSCLPRLTPAHLEHRAGDPSPQVDIVAFLQTRIIGLMTLTDTERPELGSRLWDILGGRLVQIETTRDTVYAVVQQPSPGEDYGATIMGGLEATGLDAQRGLVETTIHAATMARCPIKQLPDELPTILDYLYHTWMPKAKAKSAQTLEIIVHGHAHDSPLPGKPEAVLVPITLPPQTSVRYLKS